MAIVLDLAHDRARPDVTASATNGAALRVDGGVVRSIV